MPGESLSWFHHGRDLCVKDLEGTFLGDISLFFFSFLLIFIVTSNIFAGKLITFTYGTVESNYI